MGGGGGGGGGGGENQTFSGDLRVDVTILCIVLIYKNIPGCVSSVKMRINIALKPFMPEGSRKAPQQC